MRWYVGVLVLALVCISQGIAEAQEKYALVIGNGAYQHIKVLTNPVNDAEDIAQKLGKIGYQVTLRKNLGNISMGREITGFMRNLAKNPKNEGFFWFAGHGVEINGENYLLPVDIEDVEESALYSSYSLSRLLEQFTYTAGNEMNVVVLDACRNNPFPPSPGRKRDPVKDRGLEVLPIIPPSVYIMYSTSPKNVAEDGWGKRNSPFAEAFLKYMESNEALIMTAARVAAETLRLTGGKQQPWQGGAILIHPDYSMNPRKGDPPNPQPSPQPDPDNMVRIHGGSFMMGSPASEAGRFEDEGPQHRVRVSSFYMGKYEVTVGEFRRFVNASGYKTEAERNGGGYVWTDKGWEQKADANWKNPYISQGEKHPVVQVSWNDAVRYCNWLSEEEGLRPAYTINGESVSWNRSANGYRLPTEAEWEYACRAGTTTRYWSGNEEESLAGKANVADLTAKEKYKDWTVVNIRDGYAETAPVGSFAPNPWGLYDMHGNVWEWCWDWYGAYSSDSQTDPSGASSGSLRGSHGGSWVDGG